MSRLLEYLFGVLTSSCCIKKGGRKKKKKVPLGSKASYECSSLDFDEPDSQRRNSSGVIETVRMGEMTLVDTSCHNGLRSPPVIINNNNNPRLSWSRKEKLVPLKGAWREGTARKSDSFDNAKKYSSTSSNGKTSDPVARILGRGIAGEIQAKFFEKARRKEKDPPGSGPSSGGNDEGKLYLESALLERHLNETDLIGLVGMPSGLEKNEWMASHTIALFEHVNLIYGTISEFCTQTSCPDMTGPCMRTYLWFDERGKKVKVAAPQYIDYVMTFIQKTINDESLFPTKSTNAFPSSFQDIVKKICRLMFHVIAHIYHCHFKEIVLLSIHAHLNCVFAHFMTFNELFKLVDEKETEILQDLALAMKLRSTVSDDDPMSDCNKENIVVSKSSSFPPESTNDHPSGVTSSGSPATYGASDDSLLIKESALVNAVSDNTQ